MVDNAILFLFFLFHRLVLRQVHFTYSNLTGGLHGGLEACLFRSCIDVILVRVKVSRGIAPYYPMGINSPDSSQPPNGEISLDKSHLLLNNPNFYVPVLL
jgi:hypothetical protein